MNNSQTYTGTHTHIHYIIVYKLKSIKTKIFLFSFAHTRTQTQQLHFVMNCTISFGFGKILSGKERSRKIMRETMEINKTAVIENIVDSLLWFLLSHFHANDAFFQYWPHPPADCYRGECKHLNVLKLSWKIL